MVSRLRYSSFKGGGGLSGERVPFWVMVLALLLLIALVLDPPRVLLGAAVLYALSGPVAWAWRRRKRGA